MWDIVTQNISCSKLAYRVMPAKAGGQHLRATQSYPACLGLQVAWHSTILPAQDRCVRLHDWNIRENVSTYLVCYGEIYFVVIKTRLASSYWIANYVWSVTNKRTLCKCTSLPRCIIYRATWTFAGLILVDPSADPSWPFHPVLVDWTTCILYMPPGDCSQRRSDLDCRA